MHKRGVALFLDFDGTLVELAPTPDSIEPAPSLAKNLASLSERLDQALAIVSGRSLDDIAGHIGPLAIAVAGSHGADIRDAEGKPIGEEAQSLPDPIAMAMRDYAEQNDLIFETKPHGGALHYRSDETKGPATHDFAEALAKEHGWITQNGKCVVEIVAGKADKGSAVASFMNAEPFQSRQPVFIGDDLTDEQGFSVCIEHGGFGILVGHREPTKARYQLPDVASVHRWLGL